MTRESRVDKEVMQLLKAHAFFSSCTQKELSQIASVVQEVRFAEGVEICREGERGVGFHLIVEGETEVLVHGVARRRLGPGTAFGEIALLEGVPRTATVVATTPVRTLSIPAWSFRSLLKSHPPLGRKVLEEARRRAEHVYSKPQSDEGAAQHS